VSRALAEGFRKLRPQANDRNRAVDETTATAMSRLVCFWLAGGVITRSMALELAELTDAVADSTPRLLVADDAHLQTAIETRRARKATRTDAHTCSFRRRRLPVRP